jgi:hypothetical protein
MFEGDNLQGEQFIKMRNILLNYIPINEKYTFKLYTNANEFKLSLIRRLLIETVT